MQSEQGTEMRITSSRRRKDERKFIWKFKLISWGYVERDDVSVCCVESASHVKRRHTLANDMPSIEVSIPAEMRDDNEQATHGAYDWCHHPLRCGRTKYWIFNQNSIECFHPKGICEHVPSGGVSTTRQTENREKKNWTRATQSSTVVRRWQKNKNEIQHRWSLCTAWNVNASKRAIF